MQLILLYIPRNYASTNELLLAMETRIRMLSPEEKHLTELRKALDVGGSSWILGGGAFFLPYGLVFSFLIVAAILFTPYMLWRLYQCGRRGWLIGFAVAVLLPAGLALSTSTGGLSGYILGAIPLISFYIYTWLLRHFVSEWLENLKWSNELSLSRP